MVTPFLVLNDKILNVAVVKHSNMMKPSLPRTLRLKNCTITIHCFDLGSFNFHLNTFFFITPL